MQVKKISDSISPDVEAQIIQSLKDMHEQQMPFLIDLAKKERIRMAKLSPRYADFVDTGYRHAVTCPQFLPNYLPLEEFTKDMNLRDSLLRVREEVRILDKKLRDTIMVVNSEAFQSSRVFYNTVKAAARNKEDGAEIIVKDLATHYKRKRNGNGNGNGTENGAGNGSENGTANGTKNGEDTSDDVGKKEETS
jgi:hypothetical protein